MPSSGQSSQTAPVPAPPRTSAFRRTNAFRWWLALFVADKSASLILLLLDHPGLASLVFFADAPWLIWQMIVSSSQGLCPTVTRFATTRREVWLTIDDGPDPATTPRVLDLLEHHAARATFFVIGEKAAAHPALIAEILRRGHTVANHSHTHPCFTLWCSSAKRTNAEIDSAAQAIRRAGAPDTPWFRTPVGIKTIALHPTLVSRAGRLIGWSARGFDTLSRNPECCAARILHQIAPGAIVLLHECGPPDSCRLDAIARVLAGLTRDHFACVVPPDADLLP